jgi:uncharacterized protein with GYD domain
MKYVLLGNLSPEWASKQSERIKKAKAKLDKLGIKIESIHYTQGYYDFVDIVDAPNPEAMLAFSVAPSNQQQSVRRTGREEIRTADPRFVVWCCARRSVRGDHSMPKRCRTEQPSETGLPGWEFCRMRRSIRDFVPNEPR